MTETTTTTEKLVKIRGPYWTADVVLLKLGDPKTHRTFRSLFADINPRSDAVGQLHLPGTVLLLAFARKVVVTLSSDSKASFIFNRPSGESTPGGSLTPAAIRDLLLKGKVSLLLCSTDPTKWKSEWGPDEMPEATCELGDIVLDGLT